MSTEKITADSLIADGWTPHTAGGFDGFVGPFWSKGKGSERTMGLLVEERHCNNHLGTLHGGVVMTFADIGLGAGVAEVMGEKRMGCVTTSLQTQFIGLAKLGDFITCNAEVIRTTRDMVFVRGLIKAGAKTVASSEGIWKLMASKA